MKGVVLDFETADRICVATMKEQLAYLRKELKDHIEHGQYLHPEDRVNSEDKYIPALELLIEYFGGNL